MSLIEHIMSKLSLRGHTTAGKHPAPARPQKANTPHPAGDLTTQLCNSRQLLEVRIDNRPSSFQSMILAVDTDRGLLWLDQLTPATLPLTEGQWLTLKHHRQGEVLTLRVPVISDQSKNRNAIAVLMPDEASYRPRRVWQRFEPGSRSLVARIRAIGNSPTEARIVNISAGGLRVALTGNHLHLYRRDTYLPLCQVKISQYLQINQPAKVKSVRLVREPYRHTQVSLEFTDTSNSARAQLEQQLAMLLTNIDANQYADKENQLQLAG